MFKQISRILSLVLCFLLVLSIGGAYGFWHFAISNADPKSTDFSIRLNQFNWAGSGELPNDSLVGENHISLIDNIINHPQHGLNKSSSYLNDQIKDRQSGGLGWSGGRDTLGSMAVTQSSELSDIFGLAASNLEFLIQFKSNTEYYIFTTGVELGERGEINIWGNNKTPGQPTVPIGENIYPIYRTRVLKTGGVWAAISTEEGYAKSAWYEESRRNATATQIPSFDPDTFQAEKLT
ncbi:MAG: hypothetical protein IJ995_01665 [Clostridia bacterium]|nr:hypothetical protein [Clostridia bacterium]